MTSKRKKAPIAFLIAILISNFTIGQTIYQYKQFTEGQVVKHFSKPESQLHKTIRNQSPATTIVIDIKQTGNKVSSAHSGVNATLYTGNYQSDSTLIAHVSALKPGLIRFPGGDASNMYFFNGLPTDLPHKTLTYNGEWTDFADGTAETNWKMNTERYYAFLDSTGSTGIITVNYPYARYGTSANPVAKAASLAADWVRFDNGRTKYWEVGNETYACWEGGFRIDTTLNRDSQPEYVNGKLYGQHFRIFADSMRSAAKQIGAEIYIGAVFADDDNIWDGSQKGITKNWNDLLAKELRKPDGRNYADFVSVHSYFLNRNEQTPMEILSSITIPEELQQFINDKLDAAKIERVPLALTEWNIKPPHQTSQVGGLHAVATACRMQQIGLGAACYFSLKDHWRDDKGDFGLFANNDPALPNSLPYPPFYHLYLLNKTLGDQMVDTEISQANDTLLCFASTFTGGGVGAILINKSETEQTVRFELPNFSIGKNYYWYEVTRVDEQDIWSQKIAINSITDPVNEKGGPAQSYTTIPAWKSSSKNGIQLTIKGLSAIYLLIERKTNQ